MLNLIAEFVGFQTVTEHKLQFTAKLIIEKASIKERDNYIKNEAFISEPIQSTQRSANV